MYTMINLPLLNLTHVRYLAIPFTLHYDTMIHYVVNTCKCPLLPSFTTWGHKVHTFLPSKAGITCHGLHWETPSKSPAYSIHLCTVQGREQLFIAVLPNAPTPSDSHLPAPTSKGCHGSLEIMKLSPFLELSSSSNMFESFLCLPSEKSNVATGNPFLEMWIFHGHVR